jgi:hypothetical protein
VLILLSQHFDEFSPADMVDEGNSSTHIPKFTASSNQLAGTAVALGITPEKTTAVSLILLRATLFGMSS